jgi:hypothetical protein
MKSAHAGHKSGTPWLLWLLLAVGLLMVIVYLVLDALAGTHGV